MPFAKAESRSPFRAEQHVEQEVVEAARVPHHVHDGAARLELAQAFRVVVVEREVAEVAAREPAEEQVEARVIAERRSTRASARRRLPRVIRGGV